MRNQLLTVALSAAMTFAVVTVPITYTEDAEARGYRSSSSFSRSSFRSTSRSSPKVRSNKTSAKRPSATGGFWSKKGSKNKSLKTGGKKKASVSKGKNSVRTKQALNIQRQQNKFKKPATVPGIKGAGSKKPTSRVATNNAYRNTYQSNPVYNRARNNNPATYYDRRNNYYGRGYQPDPWVYNSSPSWGPWDTIFLYSMMNNNNNSAQFAHNHQNDSDYKAWRADANEQAKTNAELHAKLAAMDLEQQKLAGTAINPDYLPEGVDADIALAQGARLSALPDFRVCTGSTKGAYFTLTAGVLAPNAEYVNVIPVPTAGTGQALQYLTEGKCDATWAQANGYWNYIEENETANLPFSRVFSPYREGIHVMCHEDGPSKISQLDDDNKMLFPKGSGAAITMKDWIGEDEDYEEIRTVLNDPSIVVESNDDAALMVSQDKTACMMYVAAPGATQFMKDMNKSAKALKLVLIDLNDGDLDDVEDPSGADVYDTMQFEESMYGNLTRNAGVVWGGGDIHTLDVAADFLISDAWKKANKPIYSKMVLKIAGMEDRIKQVLKP